MIFTEGDTLTIGKNSDSKKLFIERRETEYNIKVRLLGV